MPRLPRRPLRIENALAFVPLSQDREAIIDVADAALIGQHNWSCSTKKSATYAVTSKNIGGGRFTTVRMHRLILAINYEVFVDHVDGNGLNNRRCNLRVATARQNACNRGAQANNASGFKGVTFYAPTNKWVAFIAIKGLRKNLGYFFTAEEAHEAYCRAALELHGEFACFGRPAGVPLLGGVA